MRSSHSGVHRKGRGVQRSRNITVIQREVKTQGYRFLVPLMPPFLLKFLCIGTTHLPTFLCSLARPECSWGEGERTMGSFLAQEGLTSSSPFQGKKGKAETRFLSHEKTLLPTSLIASSSIPTSQWVRHSVPTFFYPCPHQELMKPRLN